MTLHGRDSFRDFCRFSRGQVESGDLDPTYPVLARVYQHLPESDRLWRTLLYLAWYSLGSAAKVGLVYPVPEPIDPARLPVLPTGIERRGVRGDAGRAKAAAFLNGVLEAVGTATLDGWVSGLARGGSPEEGWVKVRTALEAVPNAGPWASYKWADLLKSVHGLPITAPDIGSKLGETAGPIPGMVRLTGMTWQECCDPQRQHDLLKRAQDGGAGLNALDQLETALCDYNSLCRGNYYLGKDIDEQQETLVRDNLGPVWWAARAASFPARYRGEAMGWSGVRPVLKSVYRDTGRLVGL
jgi:hypothetical protein